MDRNTDSFATEGDQIGKNTHYHSCLAPLNCITYSLNDAVTNTNAHLFVSLLQVSLGSLSNLAACLLPARAACL